MVPTYSIGSMCSARRPSSTARTLTARRLNRRKESFSSAAVALSIAALAMESGELLVFTCALELAMNNLVVAFGAFGAFGALVALLALVGDCWAMLATGVEAMCGSGKICPLRSTPRRCAVVRLHTALRTIHRARMRGQHRPANARSATKPRKPSGSGETPSSERYW